MEKLNHLLLFSGLCFFTQSITCEFVLIQEPKTWYQAQVHCRQNYGDLATVQTTADWTNLQESVQPALTSLTWIGLYNDINDWRWSYQDEDMTFQNWQSHQPNNKFSNQECVALDPNRWNDHVCSEMFTFFCFNENESGSNRYVWITHLGMTWFQARNYCRQHYTDLPTIRTQAEHDLLMQMKPGPEIAWIGLFRDWWEWSDGTTFDNTKMKWLSGQPDIINQNRPCGAIGPDGYTNDQLCSVALPFICLLHSKKQVVRMEVKPGQNPNDLAVVENILQLIKQKLKDHGIEDTKLTWRKRVDGNVFSPDGNGTGSEERSFDKSGCNDFFP